MYVHTYTYVYRLYINCVNFECIYIYIIKLCIDDFIYNELQYITTYVYDGVKVRTYVYNIFHLSHI